jgi:hypothetical protein
MLCRLLVRQVVRLITVFVILEGALLLLSSHDSRLGGLDREHSTLRICLKHRKQNVRELDSVVQEVIAVVLLVELLEGEAGYWDELLVENVCLENFSIPLVSLIIRTRHVTNDIQELRHILQSCVKFRV